MANAVLGLGSGQAASLNSDLIEKLKTADRKATVSPIEAKLEKFAPERESINNITTKVDELLAAVKVFSLNQLNTTNAFNAKSATTSGDAVMFDSEDTNALKTGFTTVEVVGLAQKDVWQTKITDSETSLVGAGSLTIKLGNGTEKTITTTESTTLKDLATELNKDGVSASVEKVGNNEFRLVVKSIGTGSDNKITFGGDATLLTNLGLNDSSNNILKAQDMQMKVDGVDYKNSSNTMTIDGLKITATKIGSSTINIEEDNSQLVKQMESFAKAYNELNANIDKELYNADSNISDKGALRDIMSKLKNTLFGTGNSNSSIFSYGFSFNEKNGDLTFNSTEFEKALKNDKQSLQNLFVGVAEKPGIATVMDETISISGIKKSLLDYDLNMLSREDKLKKELETAEKTIDARYQQLSLQFASYGAIINQMEASFSGLKMLIQQSTSSN